MEFISKVFSLGNSSAVRIPKLVLDSLGLKADDRISMDVSDDRIVIRKIGSEQKYPSIDELFKGYEGSLAVCEMPADDMAGKEML